MNKQIAIAHPIKAADVAKIYDPPGYALPTMQYGTVSHHNVPPGTVIIWPEDGAEPVVLDMDQLSGKLTKALKQQSTMHPLTSPIPQSIVNKYYELPPGAPSNPWKGSFLQAVDAEMAALSKSMVQEYKNATFKSSPYPPPTTEFIDSSNPFAKALDAWQTGKAEWTKGILYRPQTEGEAI